MAYTTTGSVQLILLRDYMSGDDLTAAIATAAAIIARINTCATNKGITLSSEELELIERWLAAHYYSVSNRPYKSKRTADSSATFQGETGKGLESSHYGQTAIDLDPSGCLAALNSRKRASLIWAGKPPSSQIDYSDRD